MFSLALTFAGEAVTAQGYGEGILAAANAYVQNTNNEPVFQALPLDTGWAGVPGPAGVTGDKNGNPIIKVAFSWIWSNLPYHPDFEPLPGEARMSFYPEPQPGTREYGILLGYVSALLVHEGYHLGCCHNGYLGAGMGANTCQHLAVFVAAAQKTCMDLAAVKENIAQLETELANLENDPQASEEEKEAKRAELAEERGRCEGMCTAIGEAREKADYPEKTDKAGDRIPSARETASTCSQSESVDKCPSTTPPNSSCPVMPLPPPSQPVSAPDFGYPDGVVPKCDKCPDTSSGGAE